MTEPWNLTPAQRRQFREAHAEAKRAEMAGPKNLSARQYGIRWPTGSVFSCTSREAAEAALADDERGAGVLVVHDIEPGTSNVTEWGEVED